jgi:hypothetical protein
MVLVKPVRRIGVILIAFAAVGCGEDETLTTPIQPSPVTYTETYSGTVNRNGSVTHSFFTTLAGEVTATLSTIVPEDLKVGLAMGTWNGSICDVRLINDQAVRTTIIYGNASTAASLCVRIYDVGNITGDTPASYEITVVHR